MKIEFSTSEIAELIAHNLMPQDVIRMSKPTVVPTNMLGIVKIEGKMVFSEPEPEKVEERG